MGRASTKENKTAFQVARESMGLTRESASELLEYISADRIEKIENGRSYPRPDEVMTMAEKYKSPDLCNKYCSLECPIGQAYVPEVTMKGLSDTTLAMLSSLNKVEKLKDRFIEIVADGVIEEDEYEDFANIQDELEKISMAVESLQLWVEKSIAEGKIDEKKLQEYRESRK